MKVQLRRALSLNEAWKNSERLFLKDEVSKTPRTPKVLPVNIATPSMPPRLILRIALEVNYRVI
jgi:hypothetical protein